MRSNKFHSTLFLPIFLPVLSLILSSCGQSQPHTNPDRGSQPQEQTSSCNASEKDICGPFTPELIAMCKANGGDAPCDTNRWNKAFYLQLKLELEFSSRGSRPIAAAANGELDDHAKNEFGATFISEYRKNYNNIAQEVGFTTNACARFVSAALARSGIAVNKFEAWAQNVSDELRDLGWPKITDSRALQAGDIVFTYDSHTMDPNDQYYGVSPHVYVFGGYGNSRYEALAIDNQGNGYTRNLGEGYKSPFWYAYRNK